LQIDPEYLRQHYASLTDEALRAIDKTELVEIAQKCYDEELARRRPARQAGRPYVAEDFDSEPAQSGGSKPDWLDEAVCACAFRSSPGTNTAPDADSARDVLEAAEIPCYLDVTQVDESAVPQPNYEYRLMVPSKFSLLATSVLDKEIFNAAIEADYRTHFEMLTDEELRAVDPKDLIKGLQDRIERLTRVYEEELSRRQSEAESF